MTGDRDTFFFSIGSLLPWPEPLKLPRQPKAKKKPVEGAVVEAVLNAVDDAEAAMQALEVTHPEDLTRWIKSISHCLLLVDGKVEFWRLQQMCGLSQGALLLAVLLGQDGRWNLAQNGFYAELGVMALDLQAI